MKPTIALSALLVAGMLAGCQTPGPVSVPVATGAHQAAQGHVRVALVSASQRRVQYAMGDIDRYVVRLVKDGVELASYDGDGSDVLFKHVPLGQATVHVMAYQGTTPLNRNAEEATQAVTVSNGQTATCTVDLYLALTPTGTVDTSVVVHDADDPAPSTGGSTPAQPAVDQSQLTFNQSWDIYMDDFMDEAGSIAQSFTAGQSGTLTKVSFFVTGTSGAHPSVVKLYSGDTPGASSAALLAVSETVSVPTAGGWVDYTFPTPAGLTASQPYHLQLGYANAGSMQMHYDMQVGASDTDTYVGGKGWYSNYGDNWQSLSYGQGSMDFAFQTHVQPASN